MNVFATHAAEYRDAGLPVMPVRGKAAFVPDWSRYCREMPSEEDFQVWLRQYGHCGIGLPLGPTSGLIAIDVDTDVPAYLEVITNNLPASPWIRLGSKGFIAIYRYNGETKEQLFASNDLEKKGPLLELLTLGQQIVVPPSIHPTTLRPYVANAPLVDVLGEIGTLPKDFMKRMQEHFTAAGIETSFTKASNGLPGGVRLADRVPLGGRDIMMTKLAGQLAVEIRRGEITFMESLAVIDQWAKNAAERKEGDQIDPNKGMMNLVKFLKKDVAAGGRLPEGWDKGLDDDIRAGHGLDEIPRGQVTMKFETVKETFDTALKQTDDVDQAIRDLIDNLAAADGSDILRETSMLKLAADQSGKRYTPAQLKRALKDARQRREQVRLDVTEESDTEGHQVLAANMLEWFDVVEVAPYADGALWEFDGERWVRYGHAKILDEISKRFGGREFAKRRADFKAIAEMVLSRAKIQVDEGLRPGLGRVPAVNFRNGTLTEDLVLHPHNRIFGCTYVLETVYDPRNAEKCPHFLSLLADYWAEDADYEDKVKAFRQALAVTLFGVAPRYERAFFLSGDGKNGKSTLLKILASLLPRNLVCSLSIEDFDSRFAKVRLDGKLVNVGQEVQDNRVINDKLFKEIVSGTEIEVEEKGEPRYGMTPIAAHWFGTNNVPRVNETSTGLQRRMLMFEFSKMISEGDTVRDLAEKVLAEERDAIIAWAVEGIRGLEEFTIPASHHRLMHNFIVRNNSVLGWLMNEMENGRVKVSEKAPEILEDNAYMAYRVWCTRNSVQATRLDRFQREMQRAASMFGFRVVVADVSQGRRPGYGGLLFDKLT